MAGLTPCFTPLPGLAPAGILSSWQDGWCLRVQTEIRRPSGSPPPPRPRGSAHPQGLGLGKAPRTWDIVFTRGSVTLYEGGQGERPNPSIWTGILQQKPWVHVFGRVWGKLFRRWLG